MTKYFSDKIRIVSFLSIIVVLYIHTGYPDEVNNNMTIPVIVRCCIAGVFGPLAVPMFYAISGYLFFYTIRKDADCVAKIKKRFRSLVIPYAIACVAFPAAFLIVEILSGGGGNYESAYAYKIRELPISTIICSIFWNAGDNAPWATHLWFVRDLIIIVLLSPVVFHLRRLTGLWSMVIILALYLLIPQLGFLYGLFWFISGSLLLDKIYKLSAKANLTIFICFLVLSIYKQFDSYEDVRLLRLVVIILGVISLWRIYDLFVPQKFELISMPMLNLASQFTFFVYLYHTPYLHIIVKFIPYLIGKNSLGYSLSFILSPLLFVPFIILVGYYFRKYSPKLYNIVVGGR